MPRIIDDKPSINVCEYEAVSDGTKVAKSFGFGVRHRQILLLFACITAACFTRGCMSVAILAMTSKRESGEYVQTFDWDKATQGLIMSSFYWGDLPVQFPAGVLVCKYGGKPFVTAVMIATGIFTMLTPFSADIAGWMGVCFTRMLQGAAQGFFFPSIHMLLGKWAPICERNRFGNFVYSGVYIGQIATLPATAYISSSWLGWPGAFHLFGGGCALAGIGWCCFGSNSPAEHSSISESERSFIETSLNQDASDAPLKTPWKAMAKSVPVWALIIAQVGACWGFTVMLLETPTYFKMAFGIDLESSGLLSALPYIVAWILTMFASFVADWLINQEYLSITATRKLANTLGTWGPAAGMIMLLFVPAENITLAVVMVIIIVGMDGFNSSGFLLNHIDLSPNFAGMLVSIGMTVSDTLCLFAPITVGHIVKDPSDLRQWRLVFLVSSAIYFISNSVFLLFGTAEKQYWDESKEEKHEEITSLKILDDLVPKQINSTLDLTAIVKNIEVY